MNKEVLSEDSIIEIGKSTPLASFRDFFVKATGKSCQVGNFNLG